MGCQDQFDSIDFSDNAIVFLEGFPKLNRLKSLLLNNNRISRIGRHLHGIDVTSHACGRALYATVDSLPSLEMLILTNNKIEQLQVNGVIIIHNRSFSLCLSFQALDPLSMLPSLNHLSLIGNPVTKLPNYRCVKLGSMAGSDI